ncbi:uncharacterized protein LOC144933345 [Lampetra fluviatilis]
MERDEDVVPPKDGGERASGWETTRGAESEDAPWDSFRVLVRLRPGDKSDETKRCVKVEGQHGVQINTGRGNQTQVLEFDAVLDEDASQRDVYEAIAKPLARRVLDGFHGCVATYGAPATGKTHSLYGTGLGGGRQRGLLSRAAEDIFQAFKMVPIYPLSVDMAPGDHQHTDRIRIHETDEAVSLEGLVETEVTSVEGLLKAFRKGMTNRSAGISKGEIGSRSHTIFYITVVQTVVHTQQQRSDHHNRKADTCGSRWIRTGKVPLRFTLRDLSPVVRRGALGDSERGRRLFPTSGEDDINDAKNVNRSLTLLANVIFALTTPGCQHIPYRESKLTRILRDCLGGSCCTALLVTLSAGAQAAHEAHGALQLAARARGREQRPPAKLERLVAAEVEGAQLPSQATLANGPCSSCRRERRIREEYDKFVVQARRERDALQRRVAELEQELRSRDVAPGRGDSARGGGGGGGGDAKVELGAGDDVPRRSWLTGDGDCAQSLSVAEERGAQTNGRGAEERCPKAALIAPERGDDDAQARRGSSVERHQGCEEKAQAAERAMAAAQKERDWLLVEVEELTSQLQRERDVDPGLAAAAGGGGGGGRRLERERLSAELEELRAQLGKARERERRKLATLEGEKDRLLQELQDSRAESGQLRGQTRQQQVDAAREKEILLAEIEKLNGRLQRLGAEAALLRGTVERLERAPNSHPFKQPFLGPEPQLGQRDGSYMEEGDYLEELSRAREALRQTRRERNLLLDVMSIMYTRRWFAPEATVHVRRTLQRCGVHSAQHD